MLVQNKKLAGEELTLRYATDDDGNRRVVRGNADGVFDVPEKDGNFLIGTPGWTPVRAPRAPEPSAPSAAVAPRPQIRPPAPQVDETPAATPAAAEASEEATKDDAEEEPAPDVDGLRTKQAAVELGAKYGVPLDPATMTLARMKEVLNEALFESEETSEG